MNKKNNFDTPNYLLFSTASYQQPSSDEEGKLDDNWGGGGTQAIFAYRWAADHEGLKHWPWPCLEKEFLKYIPGLGKYPPFYTPS